MKRLLFLVIASFLVAGPAEAHRLNESYIYFNVTDEALEGRVEATLGDIDKVIPLDADADGAITEAELLARESEVRAYFAERLHLWDAGRKLDPTFTRTEFLKVEFDTFALLRFELPGLTRTPDVLDMEYVFLFDGADPTHRGFAIIESNTRTGAEGNEAIFSHIFGPGTERHPLSLVPRPWTEIFVEFVKHGIWHILIGYDHILFLVTLLLSSVLFLRGRQWAPVETFGAGIWNVFKIVTVFTVAHTITLTLAATGVVTLPVVFVEAVIAASIAVVALDNIIPVFHRRQWVVVFLFGLFHGFGFANVLAPLGVDQHAKTAALAAFNIGVEIGQMTIVVVVFPILYMLRRSRFYVPVVLWFGSAMLILIALYWFFERTFDVFGNVTGTLLELLK